MKHPFHKRVEWPFQRGLDQGWILSFVVSASAGNLLSDFDFQAWETVIHSFLYDRNFSTGRVGITCIPSFKTYFCCSRRKEWEPHVAEGGMRVVILILLERPM